jgi:hypothetical protein
MKDEGLIISSITSNLNRSADDVTTMWKNMNFYSGEIHNLRNTWKGQQKVEKEEEERKDNENEVENVM